MNISESIKNVKPVEKKIYAWGIQEVSLWNEGLVQVMSILSVILRFLILSSFHKFSLVSDRKLMKVVQAAQEGQRVKEEITTPL